MSKYLLIFAVLFGVALADLAKFEQCGNDDVCEINEVRITPCKKPSLCRFKKGTSPSIAFDFTPKFSSDNIKTGLFWESPGGDVPFSEFSDVDACPYTSCPVEAGKKQDFNYSLKLSKKLPNGKYTFKWKIWTDNKDDVKCCFRTNVELKK